MKKLLLGIGFLLALPFSVSAYNGISVNVSSYNVDPLPRNAIRVPFLSIEVTAKEDVYVSEVVVRQIGLSSNDDVDGVYAEAGYKRSYRGNVDNDGLARLRFTRGVYLRAGDRETFTITANLDVEGVNRTVGFELVDIITTYDSRGSSVSRYTPRYGGSRYSGDYRPYGYDRYNVEDGYRYSYGRSYPTRSTSRYGTKSRNNYGSSRLYDRNYNRYNSRSNLSTTSSYAVPTLEFTSYGGTGTISIGRSNRVGRFRLENDGRKDVWLNRIRLKNTGTADLDEMFQSLELRNNYGGVIARSTYIDRNYVTFELDGYPIEEKDSEVFAIWGTPRYGRQGDTISFVLDESDDIDATVRNSASRSSYGSGYRYTGYRTGGSSSGASLGSYTIDRGNLIVGSRSSNYGYNLWNRDYNPGSRDVTFLSQYVSHKAPYRLDTVRAFVASGSSVGDKDGDGRSNEVDDYEEVFDDFRLYINGRYEDSARGFYSSGGQIYVEFNTSHIVDGSDQFVITGRITNEADNGDKLRLRLNKNDSFPGSELVY